MNGHTEQADAARGRQHSRTLGRGKRRRSLGMLGALALAAAASTASATKLTGEIKGAEALMNPEWMAAKDPAAHGYSFREPVGTVPAKLRGLVAYAPKELCLVALAATPQAAFAEQVLRIAGGRVTPSTLVVTPGTQLKFRNGDPFGHELYAVGQPTFQPSQTLPGGDRLWTVPASGVFEIRDRRSPSVHAWIVVEPRAVATTFPKVDGSYELELAPGQYTVQGFFAGRATGEARSVEIGDRALDQRREPLVVGVPSGTETEKSGQAEKKEQK